MNALIEKLNHSTPISEPLVRLIFIVGFFLIAWLLSRLAGRAAAWLVDHNERRRSQHGDILDTSHITSLKQRETAISLVATTARYLLYAVAIVLTVAVLTGAQRVETIVGASFFAIIIGFAVQRFLVDIVAGLLIFFEGWFRVGDSVLIEPLGIDGIVEEFSLRSAKVRAVDGELIHVANSEIKAARVLPRGYLEYEIEVFVADGERGRDVLDEIAKVVPLGPTGFVRRPTVEDVEPLGDDLLRVRARAAVAPGREWLATELYPSLAKERAPEGLIVHGPVIMRVDEQASRRFARVAWRGERPAGSVGPEAHRQLRPLRRLREAEQRRAERGRR